MHLLRLEDNGEFSLVEFVGKNIPRYAILSHTWRADHEEVTYKDLVKGTGKSKAGYAKIRFCGKQATKDNLQYFWVDTCCINKSSSAELSEAINSMFRWYQDAAGCYVYLSDVSVSGLVGDDECSQRWKPAFKKSRWFTRGWTLQELIAPASVQFFSKEEKRLGDKQSLEQILHEITGIAIQALRGSPMPYFTVDERMSWAAKRQTKREEDAAYSLLGIFNIYMPLIYGEGRQNALNRLLKEIRDDKPAIYFTPCGPPAVEMDPVTVLGAAASIVTFIDFTSKLTSTASEISKSATGQQAEKVDISAITTDTESLMERLNESMRVKTVPLSDHETAILALCGRCKELATDLLYALNRIKKTGRFKHWNDFNQAFQTIWAQNDLEALQKRLDDFRQELMLNLIVSLHLRSNQNAKRQASSRSAGKPVGQSFFQAVERIKRDKKTAKVLATGEEVSPANLAFSDNIHAEENSRWKEGLIKIIHRDIDVIKKSTEVVTPNRPPPMQQKNLQEKKLSNEILEKLSFPSLVDRHGRIAEAHKKSFEWIFSDPGTGKHAWNSFATWLRREQGLYWIAGKAGSGKSTLMKFLAAHEKTKAYLHEWASPLPLVTSFFFFWNSGQELQMSREGLLRTLLYQSLAQYPALIPRIFPARWEALMLFGEDGIPWSMKELYQAFSLLIQEDGKSARFCFFLDGLDEFDGDHSELIDFLKRMGTDYNVKLCVSSRPWAIFEDAFCQNPSLMLQYLTAPDIRLFVKDKLCHQVAFRVLEKGQPYFAADLVRSIVEKSSGVFLWVALVVASLIVGLTEGDNLADLQRRLDSLPPDLEDLFRKIIESLEPEHRTWVIQTFRIVGIALAPLRLLTLTYADETFDDALNLPINQIDEKEVLWKCQAMKRRLSSRCRGLLELAHSEQNQLDVLPIAEVHYLHRTVKDYFNRTDIWHGALAILDDSWDPGLILCQSFLMQIKGIRFFKFDASVPEATQMWNAILWCMRYADMVPLNHGRLLFTLLNDLDVSVKRIIDKSVSHGALNLNEYKPGQHWSAYLPVEDRLYYRRSNQPSDFSFLRFIVHSRVLAYPFWMMDSDLVNPQVILDLATAAFGTISSSSTLPHPVSDLTLTVMIRHALEKGANPNEQGSIGLTPWYRVLRSRVREDATASEFMVLIDTMIEHGADPYVELDKETLGVLSRCDPVWTKKRQETLDSRREPRAEGKSFWSSPWLYLLAWK